MPRNSTISRFGGTDKIRDTRPLHDKSFVQQCIRQLHEVKTLYFSAHIMYTHADFPLSCNWNVTLAASNIHLMSFLTRLMDTATTQRSEGLQHHQSYSGSLPAILA